MIKRNRKLTKREFAKEISKSTRTVERWIALGVIPNNKVFRDPTGHVMIHESAIDNLYLPYRQGGFR